MSHIPLQIVLGYLLNYEEINTLVYEVIVKLLTTEGFDINTKSNSLTSSVLFVLDENNLVM